MTAESSRLNEFGQPIGAALSGWVSPPPPTTDAIVGRHVTLVPLIASQHAAPLFAAFETASDSLWTYMSFGPFPTVADLTATIDQIDSSPDWQPFAIIVDDEPLGFFSFLRIDRLAGTIEIGSIAFSPTLQRTTAATEAVFLLIDHAFELGYRRCEWKCDSVNAPSISAARRLGFTYEGTFRQATHYKGRNRDTAWFAIIDSEWPNLRSSFSAWLAPANFDQHGRQRNTLERLRKRVDSSDDASST